MSAQLPQAAHILSKGREAEVEYRESIQSSAWQLSMSHW